MLCTWHTLFSIDLVDSRIELTGPRPFGQVHGGSLTLKESMTKVLLTRIGADWPGPASVLFGAKEHEVKIAWDIPIATLVKDNKLSKDAVVYLLPICKNIFGYTTIEGLVLKRIDDLVYSSPFVRLGKFFLEDVDMEDYFNLARNAAMYRALESELECEDQPPGKLQRYVVTLI